MLIMRWLKNACVISAMNVLFSYGELVFAQPLCVGIGGIRPTELVFVEAVW